MSTDTTGTGTARHDDTTGIEPGIGSEVENPEVPAAPAHAHVPHDPEAVVDELDVDPEEIVHELDAADVLLDADDADATESSDEAFAEFEDGVAGADEEA